MTTTAAPGKVAAARDGRADAAEALAWWRALQPLREDGRPNPLADRGALARLRRADLLGAMSERATHALLHRLRRRHEALPLVALVAATLAQCRRHQPRRPMARALGVDAEGRARLSPLRLERLLRAEEPEERLLAFRRAVQLARDEGFDLALLARDLLDTSGAWRTRWLFQYHAPDPAAAPAASPDDTQDPAEETAAA